MKKIIRVMVLITVTAVSAAPVWFLLTGMFMGNQEINDCLAPVLSGGGGYVRWRLLPLYPTLRNLIELLFDSPEYFQMFWNSVTITALITGGQLLVGAPAAWALARCRFCGRKGIYLLFILLMMMPFQVTMLSEYLTLDRLHLLDRLAAVILPGIFSTFSVFIMYRSFRGISHELIEAARVDGAGEWQAFCHIGLPLGKSGIYSAAILSFLECWSMIEQPMTFLKSKEHWPLSMFLPKISEGHVGFALCASMFTALPAIALFLSGQEHLEQGIAATAAKEASNERKPELEYGKEGM